MTMRARSTTGSLFLAALICATASCGKSPAAPGPVTKAAAVTAIRISGPSSLAPGATAQFTAIAEYSDGSTADVTSSASWFSSAADIVAFASGPGGQATALIRGEAEVSATLMRSSSPVNVLVLEPGTYRLSGLITDEAGPLPGADVEIAAGTGAGLRSTSDQLGRYAVYGVAGIVDVRVSAEGFKPVTTATEVGGNTVADFGLRSQMAPDVTGEWTLTLTASATCSARLPEIARERHYVVDITHAGTHVQLAIRGFTGPLEGRITGTTLGLPMEGDYGIFEGIAEIGTLGIDGIVTAEIQNPEIRGTLDGAFTIYGASPATCRDRAHQFVLRRAVR